MTDLIKEIYQLKGEKEALEKNLESLKKSIADLDAAISEKSDEVLAYMLENGIKEEEADGIFAIKMHRSNVGYADEKAVVTILKEKFNGQYIRTKTTEALDKIPLKKAIKENKELAEALEGQTINTSADYVIVTDAANREKILEHLN